MHVLVAWFCAGALAALTACFHRDTPHHPYPGWLPPGVHVDLAGTFSFSATGDLWLELVDPCDWASMSMAPRPPSPIVDWRLCDRSELDGVRVAAMTPWHQQVRGVWIDAAHLVFRNDWRNTGLDPLDGDAAVVVAQPWMISGVRWMPHTAEARRMLRLIDDATGHTGSLVVSGGALPDLEVTTFEANYGALRAGAESPFTVRITNHGPGTAYHVVAILRSSVASLHGRRLEFGLISPGTEKVRRLRLAVPAAETARDAMLVLALGEGNGFSPHRVSRRIPIVAPTNVPVLAVDCSILGHHAHHLDFDAGEKLMLHCVINNSGTGAARAELEVGIAGAAPVPLRVRNIAPEAYEALDVPITVPRSLAIDSVVVIEVIVRDRRFERAAGTRLIGIIRKPGLCVPGRLTRAEYRVKLEELRATMAAGDLTPAQFDRYDAELVSCLP